MILLLNQLVFSGSFDTASKHINAGAKKVIISAPADSAVKTIVLGINDDGLLADDVIVSNAHVQQTALHQWYKLLMGCVE